MAHHQFSTYFFFFFFLVAKTQSDISKCKIGSRYFSKWSNKQNLKVILFTHINEVVIQPFHKGSV